MCNVSSDLANRSFGCLIVVEINNEVDCRDFAGLLREGHDLCIDILLFHVHYTQTVHTAMHTNVHNVTVIIVFLYTCTSTVSITVKDQSLFGHGTTTNLDDTITLFFSTFTSALKPIRENEHVV